MSTAPLCVVHCPLDLESWTVEVEGPMLSQSEAVALLNQAGEAATEHVVEAGHRAEGFPGMVVRLVP